MVDPPSAAITQFVRDLQAYDGVQPYGCTLSLIAAAADCALATVEGGLNPVADGACAIALAAYVDECLL